MALHVLADNLTRVMNIMGNPAIHGGNARSGSTSAAKSERFSEGYEANLTPVRPNAFVPTPLQSMAKLNSQ